MRKKACNNCGVEKPFDDFHKGVGIGGFRGECKKCILAKRAKERRAAGIPAKGYVESYKIDGDLFKACSTCGEMKKSTYFHRDKSRKTGFESACRSCKKKFRESKNPLGYVSRRSELLELEGSLHKRCIECSIIRPLSDYGFGNCLGDREPYCKECMKVVRQRLLASRFKDEENVATYMLSRAKSRAKRLGREYDPLLSPTDILPFPETCPATGLTLIYPGKGSVQPNTMTLDRVDNSRGYVRGNVRVISYLANNQKRDLGVSELNAILNYMKSHVFPEDVP